MEKVPESLSHDGQLKFVPVSIDRCENYPYKHLILLCDSNYRRQYPTTGPNYTTLIDHDWQKYVETGADVSKIEELADCYRVRPKWANVMAQIEKCDVPKILPKNWIFEHTINKLTTYFAFLKNEPSHEVEDHSYDLSTSPGIPWNKIGFRTKRAVLEQKPEEFERLIYDLNYPIIDCYNDKDELLPKEDLVERNKVRGIFGSSFHGIYREKFAYGKQNNALLERWKTDWIKYGMVKQYGGFNNLLKSLEKFDCIVESDVSGWDRTVCLEPVYRIRNANLINPNGEYTDLINSVTESNVTPLALLPNGYVIKRPTGNNSGKNNTTTDNSIMHKIVMVYLFFKRMNEQGKELKLSHIFENSSMALYGDDKLGGMNLHEFFDSKEHYMDFEREVYAEFGLTIKKSAQLITTKSKGERISSQHSFLGSYAAYNEEVNMYVPHPRLGKVCSTFIRKYGNEDKIIRFCRAVNLTLNCYPNPPVFKQAMGFLQWWYEENKDYQWQFDEILDDVDIRINVEDSFKRVYLGFETRGALGEVF